MRLEKGTVLGIDRPNRLVRFALADDPENRIARPALEAAYLGDPPWPMSTALFANGPAYVCLGPVGDRRLIFHDDFCGDASPFGDTDWAVSGTGSVSYRQVAGDGQAGVIDLNGTTSGASYRIRKHLRAVQFGNDRALWFSARVAFDAALLAAHEAVIGFGTSNVVTSSARGATDAGVYVYFTWDPASANTFGLYCEKGTSSGIIATGEAITASQYYWLDVLVVGGSWAALWVDGAGPWLVESNVPSTTQDATTPFAAVHPNSSTAIVMSIDQFRAELVSTVAAPQGYAEAPATTLTWP